LHEVKQNSTKDVGFYARVISIIDELELLLPTAARHLAVAVMFAKIIKLASYNALPVAVRGTEQF
jgi:hypothetical protein